MPESRSRTTKSTSPDAGDSPVIVQFKEHEYKVPQGDDWPTEVVFAVIEGDIRRGALYCLGEKDFDAFMKRHPKWGDMKAFMKLVSDRAGLGN